MKPAAQNVNALRNVKHFKMGITGKMLINTQNYQAGNPFSIIAAGVNHYAGG
jgi:hypothetical protein